MLASLEGRKRPKKMKFDVKLDNIAIEVKLDHKQWDIMNEGLRDFMKKEIRKEVRKQLKAIK